MKGFSRKNTWVTKKANVKQLGGISLWKLNLLWRKEVIQKGSFKKNFKKLAALNAQVGRNPTVLKDKPAKIQEGRINPQIWG